MSHQRDTPPYAERDGGDSASARCPGAPCVRFCAYPPIHRSHSIQMPQPRTPTLEEVFGTAATAGTTRVQGEGPEGRLPLTEEMLRQEPSGNLFGLTQNVGMGGIRPAPSARSSSSSARREGCAERTAARSRSGTTRATGRSGCWSGRRRRRSASSAVCLSRSTAAIPATGARRARRGCSTASPTATTRRW